MLSTFIPSKFPARFCRSRCGSVPYRIVLHVPRVIQSDDVEVTVEETRIDKLKNTPLKAATTGACTAYIAGAANVTVAGTAPWQTAQLLRRVQSEEQTCLATMCVGYQNNKKNISCMCTLSQIGTRHMMHLQRNHQPTRPLVSP